MARYRPDIPPHVAKVIRYFPPDLKRSVKAAVRMLSGDPNCGEPLIKELEGCWKCRVKRFRIVYSIDRRHKIIRIIAVGHRREVYEELAEIVHRQS